MSLPPLSPEQLIKPRFFELRMSVIFATLFVSMGFHLPYFPLWLKSNGLDAAQIALVLSAPMFLRVFTTPLITAAADRAKDRANVYLLLLAAALTISLGYSLVSSYFAILAISLLLTVAWTPQSPLADSLALSGVRRFGCDYPSMRIWGSLAFLGANLVGGVIIGATGEGAVPLMISGGLTLALIAAFGAPRMGRPRRDSPLSAAALEAAPRVLNRPFLLIVAGSGIINGSHGFIYAFGAIYWRSLGIDDTLMGFLWGAGVAAEVGMFFVFTRLFGRVSSLTVLKLAGAAAVVRWVAFPLIWPLGLGVAGFFVVQSLHAFSTALYLIGIQRLIGETVAEERTGAAQGVAFFANGLSMATVTLLSGPIYTKLGDKGFFVMALLAAAGLVLLSLASTPKLRRGR
ncbi:MAG: MFS transporter [Rhizobiaceae bacterium]|nr:MFS transporter [Rhizobiaceae bacterium]